MMMSGDEAMLLLIVRGFMSYDTQYIIITHNTDDISCERKISFMRVRRLNGPYNHT